MKKLQKIKNEREPKANLADMKESNETFMAIKNENYINLNSYYIHNCERERRGEKKHFAEFSSICG